MIEVGPNFVKHATEAQPIPLVRAISESELQHTALALGAGTLVC